MYPGRPVSSWLSTTIESGGISTAFRVSRLIVLWAKATKGTAKKARTINANILFIIFFLLFDKYAGSPSRDPFYGIAYLNTARCSATVVPAEKLEPGYVFLSNFQIKHSRPREKGLERSVETDTRGGVKKDNCGVEQTARLLLLGCQSLVSKILLQRT